MFKEMFRENKILAIVYVISVIIGLSFSGILIYALIMFIRFLSTLVV